MYAALLLAFLAVPPDAPPVMPPDAPPVSFQSWASAELDRQRADDIAPECNPSGQVAPKAQSGAACPCGERCECVDCECPDCPHHSADVGKKVPAKSFDVVITVPATWHCEHCDRMTLGDGCPSFALQRAGHSVGIVRTDAGESFPRVWANGREFVGYTSAATILAALRPVESVRVMHDAQRHDAAKPVQTLSPPSMVMRGDYHVHVCRRCGHSWSHHDSNSGKAAPHRCANCGNYEYRIQSHSGLAPASQPVYTQPVYRSSPCPGGVCP